MDRRCISIRAARNDPLLSIATLRTRLRIISREIRQKADQRNSSPLDRSSDTSIEITKDSPGHVSSMCPTIEQARAGRDR
jgi:hypothetical protein